MNDTGLYRMDEPISNLAIGYYHDRKDGMAKLRNNLYQAPFSGTAAGGIYSTANDLLKFSRALFNNIFYKDVSKELLATRSTYDIKKLSEKEIKIRGNLIKADYSQYGFAGNWKPYGFAIWNNCYLGHTGGTVGATAILIIDPKTETIMIVLSNQDDLSTPLKIVNMTQRYLGLPVTLKNF